VPTLSGSCSAEVEFALERCWELVADIERAPRWQRTLRSVEVIERDELGRPLICDTVSDAKMFAIHCRIRLAYDRPHRLGFSRVQSDDVDLMEGAWELEPLGPALTRATYSLAIDPGPIGVLARPLERAIRPIVMGHQARELAEALAAGI
jgi:hypothetical protein